jgi:hypothetical protein
MPYKILVQQLWPTADGVVVFLRTEWGIRKLVTEQKVYDGIEAVATFNGSMPDSHVLWVEVSNRPYPTHLDAIVADCIQQCLPVRLIVAIPKGSGGPTYNEDLSRAHQKGVGVIEMAGENGKILVHPVTLSLAGVRPIPRKEFPEKLRYRLSQSEATFREGNPAKGCDDLFAIVEDVSRKIAEKTFKQGLWKAGSNPPKFGTDSWSSVMEALEKQLDKGKCKLFKDNILHRVLGVTPFRNQVVHVPKTTAALVKRDGMLRTRFEDAANLLLELLTFAKPLKIKLD